MSSSVYLIGLKAGECHDAAVASLFPDSLALDREGRLVTLGRMAGRSLAVLEGREPGREMDAGEREEWTARLMSAGVGDMLELARKEGVEPWGPAGSGYPCGVSADGLSLVPWGMLEHPQAGTVLADSLRDGGPDDLYGFACGLADGRVNDIGHVCTDYGKWGFTSVRIGPGVMHDLVGRAAALAESGGMPGFAGLHAALPRWDARLDAFESFLVVRD